MTEPVATEAYDFPLAKLPVSGPLPGGQGMTNDEIDDAWEAHLRYLAHNE